MKDWPQIQHIPASLYLRNSRITSAHHLAQSDHEHSSHVKSNLASISTSTTSFGRAPTRDLVPEHAECLSFIPSNICLRKLIIPCLDCYKNPQKAPGFPSEAVRCDIL